MTLIDRLPRVDRRTVVGAILALLAGVLVLMITRPEPTISVLIAGESLPAGIPLEELAIDSREVSSSDGLIEGVEVGELADWSLVAPVGAGEPLLPSLLQPPNQSDATDLMALSLEPGHAVLGQLSVGDLVDIYLTVPGRELDAIPPTIELVATDVFVAHLGTVPSGIGAGGGVEILVAVDDTLAANLLGARAIGQLDLVRVGP